MASNNLQVSQQLLPGRLKHGRNHLISVLEGQRVAFIMSIPTWFQQKFEFEVEWMGFTGLFVIVVFRGFLVKHKFRCIKHGRFLIAETFCSYVGLPGGVDVKGCALTSRACQMHFQLYT